MRIDAFSEDYALIGGQNGGLMGLTVRGMDTRIKLMFAASCILLSVASASPAVPATVGLVCIGLLAASGAPARAVALRMAEPLLFALILAAFQVFLTSGDTLAGFTISGHSLTVSAQGLDKGVTIISRVFGAVTATLFLTMTTPAHRLLSAAARLKAPKTLVELALLAYRYIFVLLEGAVTTFHAQRGRLGYVGLARSVRSLATLTGSVFLRALDQAEATSGAMAMRGYTGEYVPTFHEEFRARDAVVLGLLISPCMAVFIWTL